MLFRSPKSVSHEHTFSEDTRDASVLEGTLLRLSEMVGRRLREHQLHARTVQLRLRYSDFSTITRAQTLERSTQLDNEIFQAIRELFRKNWKAGREIRLLGVHTSGFDVAGESGQLDLIGQGTHQRWEQALSAADKLRDKFGESTIVLGTSLKRNLRERVHEALPDRPGKKPKS